MTTELRLWRVSLTSTMQTHSLLLIYQTDIDNYEEKRYFYWKELGAQI